MLFFLFDPGFLFFIILFFVLGAIGMFMEIATTLFSILLTAVVLVGLFAYLLYKYGMKGLMAWFVGLAIIICGFFVMDQIQSTPHGRYNSAKYNSCIVLRAVNEFEHSGHSFSGQAIIALSWLDSKKDYTDVNVYEESGQTSFGLGGSITSAKNQFVNNGAKQLARTNEAVWEGVIHSFDNTKDIMKLSDKEIVELINQTSNELDEREKEGKEDELNHYYEDIIGKQYADYNTPSAGFLPGQAMDGVKITIIDRNTLKYQSGRFAMVEGDDGYSWMPLEISKDEEYEYRLKKDFFGKLHIIINNGQYKYTFETDSAYKIQRLDAYK